MGLTGKWMVVGMRRWDHDPDALSPVPLNDPLVSTLSICEEIVVDGKLTYGPTLYRANIDKQGYVDRAFAEARWQEALERAREVVRLHNESELEKLGRAGD